HSETSFTPGRCEHAAQPDPVDLDRFVHEPLPQDRLPQGARSYDEADLSDKSSAVSSLPRLDAAARAQILRRYRCQLASLRSVDRGFRQLVRALGRTGSLRDTAVVFTSDNGFFHGEHRLQRNKGYPYEEAIRVPLLIRLPPAAGIGSRTTVGSPVANIDITATILELAGAQSCKGPRRCRILDGRSLLPLIARGPSDWPDDRAILIEQERHEYLCAAFAAIWRPAEMLARYPTPTGPGGACSPEHEHYETARDPMQLENAFPAAEGSSGRERQADLLGELSRLRRCAGVAGRDERSGGRPFCE
ncbi:MAG TPA: sulfatase-like hydrolase/transferase, partial [Solirubrobacterales bacterium]|nr:sulfatase-like hydrolase/transferase [Solirubrobacterales bacterium]